MTAALCGASLLAALAALRAGGEATAAAAFFAGRELRWPCPFKLLVGLDCPGCGMTRGVLLALQGDWGGAWLMNPGAPLLVAGAALLGAGLLWAALRPGGRADASFARRAGRLKLFASAYAALTAAFVLSRWALALV
jgi:hypothetical protein